MDFYLSASRSLGSCVPLLALQIEKKKKRKKKRGTYKSIIRKQVKGQNSLDVALFSPYPERTVCSTGEDILQAFDKWA